MRVILGKMPESDETTSRFCHRSGNSGLFISKPSKNVFSCSDSDLIFDTNAGFYLQTLMSGSVIVANAENTTTPAQTVIYTSINTPLHNSAAIYIDWNVATRTSNLSINFFPDDWNSPVSSGYVFTNANYLTQTVNMEKGSGNSLIPGYTLTAETKANTDHVPNTIDIVFTNGSVSKEQYVFWTIFQERASE